MTGRAGHVRSQRDGGLLTVTLDRPAKLNALTLGMFEDFALALREAADDPDVRAVLIQGAGRCFSAGVDVEEIQAMHTMAPSRARAVVRAWQRAIESVEEIEAPVIARLHGHVVGGALELASACDLRVTALDARLSMPESRLGALPDGGSVRLVRHIGLGRAKELILTGRVIDGAEAERIGLVARAVPEDALDDAVAELLGRLALMAPRGVGLAKRVLNHGSGVDARTAMELEALASGSLYPSADFAEGCAAFQERRAPDFRGV